MKSTSLLARGVLLPLCVAALVGCSTPEDKVASYSKRGQNFLEKGEVVKARLEFQNALQINPNAVAALFGLAEVAERNRDWQRAFIIFGKVVELDASHLPARVKLGKLLLASGQLDKALEASDIALKQKPGDPAVLALRAAVFFKLQDPKSAIDLATRALAADPHHVDALVVLAFERLHANDAAGAVVFLDKGLEANERNVSVQLIKVQALEKLAHTDKAEGVLRRLIAYFPEDAQYRYILGQFYLAHREPQKAEAEYRAVATASPQAMPPKLELVRFLASVKGQDAAAAQLEAFIKAEPKNQDLKLNLASVRLQQNKGAEAQALWKQVIAEATENQVAVRARGALAAYHLGRNDKAAAKPLIDELLAKDARNEHGLLLRASIAADERRLDDAINDLRTILRDVPDSARAQLQLARAHELQGLPELALQHYSRGAQVARYAPQFAMPYAQYLLNTGRARQVEGVLREVLRFAPGYLPAQKMLAQAYLSTGNLPAAQAVADEVGANQAEAVAANQIRGAVAAARKDFDNSIASFKKAYELAPTEVQPIAALVRSYLLANKPREALSFVESVVAASPDNTPAHMLHAELLMQVGQRNAARDVLEKVIARDGRTPLPHLVLVKLHAEAKDFAEARQVVERGLKSNPNDFSLRLAGAGLLESQGKFDEAIGAYDSLLQERPNAIVVANNLASLLADHRKDQTSVRRAYDLAQRFRGTDIPHLKDTVGWTAHLNGKPQDAADLLKSASNQIPDLAVVQYHYGMNQLALNNRAAAKQALQRALELAKNTPFIQVEDARKTLQAL
jgi:tetratricopeptide (TPR) repeat protein